MTQIDKNVDENSETGAWMECTKLAYIIRHGGNVEDGIQNTL